MWGSEAYLEEKLRLPRTSRAGSSAHVFPGLLMGSVNDGFPVSMVMNSNFKIHLFLITCLFLMEVIFVERNMLII